MSATPNINAKKISGLPLLSRTFVRQNPTASDTIVMFRVDEAITIQEIIVVSQGTTPSTTFALKHTTDISSSGTDIVSSATFTNATTGTTATLSDATIPADSFIMFVTSAVSGSDVFVNIDIRYTID
tara:strand:- start:1318 stop:1698 length:381 start_codon:yes stop_codon:yes gene_type:complete